MVFIIQDAIPNIFGCSEKWREMSIAPLLITFNIIYSEKKREQRNQRF